ncbi:Bromodomain-containing protein [Martensiomyces pterosporus]|nr:Bromodomain-containing protein [Martensiomyces pterosporus]
MPQFSVNHQIVSLDIDFGKRIIKGLTELSIEPKTRDISAIRLHCERPVVRSANINGYGCEFRRVAPGTRLELLRKLSRTQEGSGFDDGELEITIPPQVQIEALPESMNKSVADEVEEPAYRTLKLRIEFYMVNPASGVVFGSSDTDSRLSTVHTETQIYPSSTRAWLPCLDDIHERSTWDLFFTVPACIGSLENPQSLLPMTVVSAGELSSLVVHPRDPTRRIFRYIMSTATPACTLGFAIGPFTSAYTLDSSLLANGAEGSNDVFASRASDSKDAGGGGGAHQADGTKDPSMQNGDSSEEALGDSDANQQVPSIAGEGEPAEGQAAKTSHNSKLRKATVDAIGGMFAFTYPGMQSELENTCDFIPEALAFHSQEFGSYPYSTYKVVFMDGLREPIITCASLTIVSTDFLHPRTIIEQVYETRRCLGLAIAQQWFGTYITPETWSDYWLVVGLAGFAASLFVKHNLGNNEHRYRLKRDMTRLCHADVNQRPISYPDQPPVVRPDQIAFMQLKAPIILYMLDKRMMKGGMSLGLHRIVPKILVAAMSGDLGASNAVGTGWFLKMCRKVSGIDLKVFADQWIHGTGCPVFHFSYAFNRKKLVVEITMHQESTNSKATAPWAKPQLFNGQMTARIREADGTPYEHVLDIHEACKKFEVQFNTKYKRIRRSTKRFHMRQMAAAAEELNVNAEVLGIEDDDETYSNIALFGAENEQEKRDWRVVEWGEDDEESLASATFEWIRMDSDLEWACIIHFEQPDFMWAAQLQKDRDVAAQLEAVDALQHLPSSAASTTLMRTVMDGRVFYRVRVDAALALEKFAKESLGWIGLHHLIKIYKNRYCLPPASVNGADQGDSEDISAARLPKPNNFANVGEYFTQKAILAALSNIRDRNNESPAAARKLMIGALRYNDNSENVYSDCYYLSSLIQSLSNSIIASDRFTKQYSVSADPQGDDAVLSEIERLRKLDMLVPSYHNVITANCMEVLLKLSLVQSQEHLFNTALFFSMSTPDAYTLVREVATGGLILHWGLSDPAFNRYFMALAADSEYPWLAVSTSRYMLEVLMIRSMIFGQQHNSLLFLEEEGSEATEYIDTDARLVGGLESFIETTADSPEFETIISSAVYDSTLAQSARAFLANMHMLLYQTVDCSLPPRAPAARKKLKIKLGGKRRGGAKGSVADSQLNARSNASSDSEDVPLALSMANAAKFQSVPGGITVSEDPYSADAIPGELEDTSSLPLSRTLDGHDEYKRRRRKPKREPSVDITDSGQSPPYALPPIAGTRPPPIAASEALPLSSPAHPVPGAADVAGGYGDGSLHMPPAPPAPHQQQQQPPPPSAPPTKLKLKLKLSKASVASPPAPASRGSPAHHHHAHTPAFSPSMSPPQYHSTVPHVSSPLATHAMSPSRKSQGRSTPQAWSPAYNPPDIEAPLAHAAQPSVLKSETVLPDGNAGGFVDAPLTDSAGGYTQEAKSEKAKKKRKRKTEPVHSGGFTDEPSPQAREQLPASAHKLLVRILRKVSKHPSAFPFLRPVDVVLDGCPTYYDVIKHPMDLGTIKQKLDAWKYSSAAELEADVKQMLNNCYTFNPPGTPVHNLGQDVEGVFEAEWSKAGLAAAPSANFTVEAGQPQAVTTDAVSLTPAAAAAADSNETVTPASKTKVGQRQNKRKSVSELSLADAERPESSGDVLKRRKTSDGSDAPLGTLSAAGGVGGGEDGLVTPVKSTKISRTKSTGKSRAADSSSSSKSSKSSKSGRPVGVKLKMSSKASAPADAAPAQQPGSRSPSAQSSLRALDDPDAILEYLDKTDKLAQTSAVGFDELAVCRRVLLRLQAQPSSLEFMAPVDPVKQGVPTYFDVVKHPMDLGTIRKKLDRGKYHRAMEFRDDVQLVLSNCFLFNTPGTYVYTQGMNLQKTFNEVWKRHWGAEPSDPIPTQLPGGGEIPMSEKEAHTRARAILNKIKNDQNSWPFLQPVDPVALGVPTYFDIVKNPMDLSTIQKRLGKKTYKTVADFICDIRLIIDDCFLFNLPDTPVHDCGSAVQKLAVTLLEPDGWTRWFM